MKKSILFDLDGTICDSGEGIINCAIYALEHFGCHIPSREDLRVFVGPPLKDSFLRHGIPEDKTDEAIAIYRSRYLPIGKYENYPYPGIEQLLKQLKDDGHALYIATSKLESTAVDVLEHFGLAHYFTRICGASADEVRSSKSQVIEYLIQCSGHPEHMVMVGDAAYDVIGAKPHGIETVGVSWGYGNIQEMQNAGAVAIAHTTEELYHLLT